MRATRIMIPFLLAVLLAGCKLEEGCLGPIDGLPVLSVHPLFEERDLVFDPALVGSWMNQDGEKLSLQRAGQKGYRLIIGSDREEQAKEEYTVRLVELAGLQFLDFSSRESTLANIPGHLFAKVRIDGDVIRLAFLKDDWIAGKVLQERSLLYEQAACGEQKGPVVVTSSTRELQNFVLRYAQDADPFDDEIELRRGID